jgi:hypothetical protein
MIKEEGENEKKEGYESEINKDDSESARDK